MTPEQQLNTILISLGGWATLTTVTILLARRDWKLGLKKWLYLKLRKQPLAIRYHGPDKSVTEMVIAMKGKGESITLFDKKLLFIKTGEGMNFFIDEAAIRRRDDGINELSYSYRSVMPIDPSLTREEIRAELEEFVRRTKTEEQKKREQAEGFEAVEVDQLIRYTDPKRLNKFIDYVYLAAKADALAAASNIEKWVKWTLIGVAAAVIGIIAIYYTLDGKMLPMLQQISSVVGSLGAQVAGAINL